MQTTEQAPTSPLSANKQQAEKLRQEKARGAGLEDCETERGSGENIWLDEGKINYLFGA